MQQLSSDRPSPPFGVEREVRGTTQIVVVRGDVDIAAGQALTAAIDRAIGLLPDRVVIDLSATTFMDSVGVHCLLRAHRHARARNVDLVVIPGPAHVQRVLALCGVDEQLGLGRSTSRAKRATTDEIQRKLTAARRAARYVIREAEHHKSLSHTLLHADRQMRRRLHLDPPHNPTPGA